jgi:hypothetical protein
MARSAQHARQSCAPARHPLRVVLAGSRWHAPISRASYGMARSASRCRTATAERAFAILTNSPPGEAIIRRHDRIDCPVAMAA